MARTQTGDNERRLTMYASIDIDEEQGMFIGVDEKVNEETPPSVEISLFSTYQKVDDDLIKIKCETWEDALKFGKELMTAIEIAYENSSLKSVEKEDKELEEKIEEQPEVKPTLRLIKPDKRDS